MAKDRRIVWGCLAGIVLLLAACANLTPPPTPVAVPSAYPIAVPSAYPANTGYTPPPSPDVGAQWTAQAIQNATAEAELRATSTPAPTLTPITQGPLLRDVWAISPTDSLSITHLLHFNRRGIGAGHTLSVVPITQGGNATSSFTVSDFYPDFFGLWVTCALSPQRTWIACHMSNNDTSGLGISRLDGSDDRLLAQYGIANDTVPWSWSPDGKRLVFKQWHADQPAFQQWVLHGYDVPTRTELAQVGGLHAVRIIGWQDNTHMLALVVPEMHDTRNLERINMVTGARQVIDDTLPRSGSAHTLLSPDRRTILFRFSDHQGTPDRFLYDLTTRQRTPVAPEVASGRLVWSLDSRGWLQLPVEENGSLRFVSADRPTRPITLALNIPMHISGTSAHLESVSPDGRYLLIVEGFEAVGAQSPSYRTLLYDVLAHRWTVLHKDEWERVVGWIAAEELP